MEIQREPKHLTVYKASAGTGKTYTLARAFTELSVLTGNPYAFSRILAVTFTKKATAEMKARIVAFLAEIAHEDASSLRREVQANLREKGYALEEETIRLRAGRTLHTMLHEYSRLSISTIDSFLKRMASALFWELGISPEVGVRLDETQMVNAAVELMLKSLSRPVDGNAEDDLLLFLMEYARTLMREAGQKSPARELYSAGEELFKEPFVRKTQQEQEAMLDLDKGREIRKLLHAKQQAAVAKGTATFRQLVDDILGAVGEEGVKYFDKIKSLRDEETFRRMKWSQFPPALQNIERVFKANVTLDNAFLLQAATRAQEGFECLVENLTYSAVLQSYDKFVTLAHIRHALKTLERTESQFPLKEFSVLLRQLKGEDDLSFIFERMGSRYESIFIDEFQDTNRLQWDLLRPLVANSVDSGNYSLIVGDVKQSIYRWNGGDWKLLGEEVRQDPALGAHVDEVRLDRNYRSARDIVEFNKTVFGSLRGKFAGYAKLLFEKLPDDHLECQFNEAADLLAEQAYDVTEEQAKWADKPGYVELTYEPTMKKSTSQDEMPEDEEGQEGDPATTWAVDKVREVVNQGILPGQVAIIVRTRSRARDIVMSLLAAHAESPIHEGFTVVSQDGLQLSSSSCVKVALAALRIGAGMGTDIDRALVAQHLAKGLDDPQWAFKVKHLEELEDSPLGLVLKEKFKRLGMLRGYALLEAFDRICGLFGLPSAEEINQKPYIDKLRDVIYGFTKSESSSLAAFVQWYDHLQDEPSVDLVQSDNAINVLTVHKSKGLEFDIVLCPDCDYPLQAGGNRQPNIWEEASKLGDEAVLEGRRFAVKVSKGNLPTQFGDGVANDLFMQAVDALNLLYVAFTRPKEALYLYYAPNLKSAGRGKELSISPRGILSAVLHDTLSRLFSDSILPVDEVKEIYGYPKSGGGLACKGRESSQGGREIHLLDRIPQDGWGMRERGIDLALNIGKREALEAAINRRHAAVRGERLHGIMADAKGTPEDITSHLEAGLRDLVKYGVCTADYAEETVRIVREGLETSPTLQEAFHPDNPTLAERDLLRSDGSTHRPDRVSLLTDRTIVLDYKFGAPREKHKEQVQLYMDDLSTIGLPNPEGYLWYILPEQKKWELAQV